MDIKEFAHRLGFSPTTISHALSGKRHVKEETRQLILEKMREWGYTPNINAQRMLNPTTQLFAFYSEVTDMLTDPYQLEVLRTFCRRLRPCGYDLILDLYRKDDHDRFASLKHRVAAHAIDGAILIAENIVPELLAEISAPHSPAVYIHNKPAETPQANVGHLTVNSHDAYREVLLALRQLGRTEVLLLGRNDGDYVWEDCQAQLRECGLSLYGNQVIYSEEEETSAGDAVLMALLSPQRPSVVITRTHAQARGVFEKALQLGIKVPEQLSIISHGDEKFARTTSMRLATISFDYQKLAERSIEMLFEMREHPEVIQPAVVIQERFVPGGSLI